MKKRLILFALMVSSLQIFVMDQDSEVAGFFEGERTLICRSLAADGDDDIISVFGSLSLRKMPSSTKQDLSKMGSTDVESISSLASPLSISLSGYDGDDENMYRPGIGFDGVLDLGDYALSIRDIEESKGTLFAHEFSKESTERQVRPQLKIIIPTPKRRRSELSDYISSDDSDMSDHDSDMSDHSARKTSRIIKKYRY